MLACRMDHSRPAGLRRGEKADRQDRAPGRGARRSGGPSQWAGLGKARHRWRKGREPVGVDRGRVRERRRVRARVKDRGGVRWRARRDSNPRPSGPQPSWPSKSPQFSPLRRARLQVQYGDTESHASPQIAPVSERLLARPLADLPCAATSTVTRPRPVRRHYGSFRPRPEPLRRDPRPALGVGCLGRPRRWRRVAPGVPAGLRVGVGVAYTRRVSKRPSLRVLFRPPTSASTTVASSAKSIVDPRHDRSYRSSG
jgi:hypothetical protein